MTARTRARAAAGKPSNRRQLDKLESLRESFGAPAAREKLQALAMLERGSLARAADVERLHEMLCFMRAWPDSPKLLAVVNRMLKNFSAREDLQRFAAKLTDTGIAGTEIRFRFYFATARWLARHCGDALQIDWREFDAGEQLANQLGLLSVFSERAALLQFEYDVREWLELLRDDAETDAVFLVNRYAALEASETLREHLFEALDPAFRLSASPTTPSRTLEYQRPAKVLFQKRRIGRDASDLRTSAKMRIRIESMRGKQAERLVDLAKKSMVARLRDLDAIAYASPDDVMRVHCRSGIQIVLLGMQPRKRYLLESEYGYLMLRNGAVVGYGTGTGLYGSCQIAFNLFPTYRGVATGELYASVLATFRHLFDADTFSVDCYQIGADNDEAINSGAWWFYARMGFLPRDADGLKLAQRELDNAQRKRGYRSSKGVLRDLAQYPLYLSLGEKRTDVLGPVCTDSISLGVAEFMSERFGSRREEGVVQCAQELGEALGVDSISDWRADEQLMWRRLSPLFAAMGGIAEWPRADRESLIAVIRAKGGEREADYVSLFDAHSRLRRAVAGFSEINAV